MDSLTMELVFNASGDTFTIFFTRASKLGGAMGGCTFGDILPIPVPKHNGEKFQTF